MDTRDELLISLLASEELLDSREYDILSAEEVEDLKQVRRNIGLICCDLTKTSTAT